MSSSKTHLKRALAGILLIAAVLFVAYAQDKPNVQEPRKAPPSKGQAAQPADGGFRAFIDPATGKLRDAEPGEAAALQSPASRLLVTGAAAPDPISLRGGGVGLRLGESQMVYSIAKIGPDGKLVTGCVTGRQQAEAVLRTPVAKEALDVK